MSSSNCCFLTCIQVSQKAGQVVWYSHLLKNFPQFIVIHKVKGFGIVNKAEVYVSSGISQARILEWVAISSSRGFSQLRDQTHIPCVGRWALYHCATWGCIQVSQKACQVVWYSHLFKNFPQFVVINTVKSFGVVNKSEIDFLIYKAEVDVFYGILLLSWWSKRYWQFALWFLCLFWIQFEHLEVHGSWTVEAWFGEFWGLLC